MDIAPVRQTSKGDTVAHQLRVLIIRGELAAGTHLVEGGLAEKFDVSRGPIRDALHQLETEGLLESRRRGLFVRGLTDDDLDELYTLRESLETLALRRAMARADPGEWHAMEGSLALMRHAAERGRPDEFAQADMDFHSHLYRLSRHGRLLALWESYRPTFAVILDLTNAQDRDLTPPAEAHAELLGMVRGTDVERAVSMLSEHLRGSRNRLTGALDAAQNSA